MVMQEEETKCTQKRELQTLLRTSSRAEICFSMTASIARHCSALTAECTATHGLASRASTRARSVSCCVRACATAALLSSWLRSSAGTFVRTSSTAAADSLVRAPRSLAVRWSCSMSARSTAAARAAATSSSPLSGSGQSAVTACARHVSGTAARKFSVLRGGTAHQRSCPAAASRTATRGAAPGPTTNAAPANGGGGVSRETKSGTRSAGGGGTQADAEAVRMR